MDIFVFSFYNIFIPIPERSEYLLYNVLRGGLCSLSAEEYEEIKKYNSNQFITHAQCNDNPLLKLLIDAEFYVDANINEVDEFVKIYNQRRNSAFYSDSANISLTIASSNLCNMACPYCYEFSKDNSILNTTVSKEIANYIKSMIESSCQIKKWKFLSVTWYGGEPLLGKDAIPELTNYLKTIAVHNGMHYNADIITNGTLLTKEVWKMLENNSITNVQVTIDGAQETHDKLRPLKSKKESNYWRIVENLSMMPKDISLTIRVNVDKKVAANFSVFLKDLEKHGIWPKRCLNVNIDLAWLRTYPAAKEEHISDRIMTSTEWAAYKLQLRKVTIDYYNKWAMENMGKPGKLRLNQISTKFNDCYTVISPFYFTIDAQGYVYKCWEVIHEKDYRVQHVSELYDITKFQKYLNRSRFSTIANDCFICKYLPICDREMCLNNALYTCEDFRNSINEELKAQYLMQLQYPETVIYHSKDINK